MVRSYKSTFIRSQNNIYGYNSMITEENIDKLLMSPDYSDALKDIFSDYKNHLLGRGSIGLFELKTYYTSNIKTIPLFTLK